MIDRKPIAASPVDANADIAEHEVSGFHATSTDEWVASLMHLCDDRALAREMGRRGRQIVKKQFSVRTTAPRWIRLVKKIRKLWAED